MGIFLFFDQLEAKRFALISLKNGPLSITSTGEEILVVVGEFQLHNSLVMGIESTGWHSCLVFVKVPNDNIGVLCL